MMCPGQRVLQAGGTPWVWTRAGLCCEARGGRGKLVQADLGVSPLSWPEDEGAGGGIPAGARGEAGRGGGPARSQWGAGAGGGGVKTPPPRCRRASECPGGGAERRAAPEGSPAERGAAGPRGWMPAGAGAGPGLPGRAVPWQGSGGVPGGPVAPH